MSYWCTDHQRVEVGNHDAATPTLERERDELRAEIERLQAALEKHHDHLSDEPGDHCRACGLDYLARPKKES